MDEDPVAGRYQRSIHRRAIRAFNKVVSASDLRGIAGAVRTKDSALSEKLQEIADRMANPRLATPLIVEEILRQGTELQEKMLGLPPLKEGDLSWEERRARKSGAGKEGIPARLNFSARWSVIDRRATKKVLPELLGGEKICSLTSE
jgi:hypothetical protein